MRIGKKRLSSPPLAITEENIFRCMPDREWATITAIIKALNLRDIMDARNLGRKLKAMLEQGQLEGETRDGKFYYKKAGKISIE